MPLFLGADIGTSSTKAVLVDDDGTLLAAFGADHPIHRPHAGWSEQDPEDWWTSTRAAIAGVLASARVPAGQVACVGLSGQMHGSVFLGADAESSGGKARALRRALLWNDQRTAAQCDEIERRVGGRRRLVELVGNAALTGFTLPKVMWLREHEPEVFARVAKVALPKDFIRLRLTGELATDVGDASGTLIFDVDKRTWSDQAQRLLGFSSSIFPRAMESAAIAGRISPWASEQTGLPAGTPVVAGSGDNMTGAVGAGIVEPGMVLATLGTSGVIYAHSDRPRRDLPTAASTAATNPAGAPATGEPPVGRLHTMCAGDGDARTPGAWCVTGCMLSAAGSLHWCRDTIAPGIAFDQLMEEAAAVPPGCEGLVFLPYLTGERCPYPDPDARAGWIGLTARHGRGHLVRSVLEGVTFGMGQILDLVRGIGVPVSSVRLGGGGAKSPLWRQMLADVFGTSVESTNTEEGPAYGAALMAGVGAGRWGSVAEACRACVKRTELREPGPARPYEVSRAVYGRLYAELRAEMRSLAGRNDVAGLATPGHAPSTTGGTAQLAL